MEKKYYIAYGSNLSMERMKRRCPDAKAVGTANIFNCRLEFRGSGSGNYLTIVPGTGTVPVGIWEVSRADEKALDRYEGFPVFYHKEDFAVPVKEIKTGKVRTRTCFAYVMNKGAKIGVPSAEYAGICLEGYRDFGFTAEVLLNAYERSREAGNDEE